MKLKAILLASMFALSVGGAHAGLAAEGVHAQASVVGHGGQAAGTAGVAGLGQGVFNEGVERFLGLGNAQLGLADELDAQGREHGLELGQLARVVGGQDQLHARAFFCSSTSSAMPFSANASSWFISSRVKAAPSAVPCTST